MILPIAILMAATSGTAGLCDLPLQEKEECACCASAEVLEEVVNEPNTLTEAEKALGFKLLFDGKTTKGWRGYKMESMPSGWKAVDGVLRFVNGEGLLGGDICPDIVLGDCDFRWEWKMSPGGNSGVIYRVSEDGEASYHSGPEYQLLDDNAEKYNDLENVHKTAANYALQAPSRNDLLKPAGQWNAGRIVFRGDHITHWLNGVKVVEYTMYSDTWTKQMKASKFVDFPNYAKNKKGLIFFQDHGNAVEIRSVRVKTF
jgi:hypothetical protein